MGWEQRFEMESNKMIASFHSKWNKLQEKFLSLTKDTYNSESETMNEYSERKKSKTMAKDLKRQRQNSKSLDMLYYDDEGYFSEEDEKKENGKDYLKNEKSYKRSNQIDSSYKKERQNSKESRSKSNQRYQRDNEHEDRRRGEYSRQNAKRESDMKENWINKRSEGRKHQRNEESNSDWLFDRAKHRKDIRHEEERGEWYFERKRGEKDREEYPKVEKTLYRSDERKFNKERMGSRGNKDKYRKSKSERKEEFFNGRESFTNTFDKLGKRLNDFIQI